MVKFFPAGNYGGIKTIKSLASVFTDMKFMPTGGVNPENLRDFLDFKKVIAVGGTWVCKPALIESGKFDEIEKLCREARELADK